MIVVKFVCLNVIHEQWNLQFYFDSEQQRFEKLFNVCENKSEFEYPRHKPKTCYRVPYGIKTRIFSNFKIIVQIGASGIKLKVVC